MCNLKTFISPPAKRHTYGTLSRPIKIRTCDRFGQYGIKVCCWGSDTLKIVIYVENYPQKRSFLLVDYHPLWVGGC